MKEINKVKNQYYYHSYQKELLKQQMI